MTDRCLAKGSRTFLTWKLIVYYVESYWLASIDGMSDCALVSILFGYAARRSLFLLMRQTAKSRQFEHDGKPFEKHT